MNSTSYSLLYPFSHLNITMNSEGIVAMQKYLGFKGHHIDHILCLLQLASTSKKIDHPCSNTALQKLQKFCQLNPTDSKALNRLHLWIQFQCLCPLPHIPKNPRIMTLLCDHLSEHSPAILYAPTFGTHFHISQNHVTPRDRTQWT